MTAPVIQEKKPVIQNAADVKIEKSRTNLDQIVDF
jgi:hypothetical protein